MFVAMMQECLKVSHSGVTTGKECKNGLMLGQYVKLHYRCVLCHWSNGLEESSTECGSLQMLPCSHYIM